MFIIISIFFALLIFRRINVCIFVCICMCICMYMYMYIYMYIYILIMSSLSSHLCLYQGCHSSTLYIIFFPFISIISFSFLFYIIIDYRQRMVALLCTCMHIPQPDNYLINFLIHSFFFYNIYFLLR